MDWFLYDHGPRHERFNPLNASVSLRDQSIDFLGKSIDWFLYEGSI